MESLAATVIHHSTLSPFRPPPRFSRALMCQRGGRRKDDPETGKRERGGGREGGVMGEPTNAAISSFFFHRLDFFP